MPWFEIFKLVLPLILDLLDKTKEERAKALPRYQSLFLVGEAAAEPVSMVIGMVGACVCGLPDDAYAQFQSDSRAVRKVMREANS